MNPSSASEQPIRNSDPEIDSIRRRERRRPRRVPRRRICGRCGWSLYAGKNGWLLCANPDSPYCYDMVEVGMSCPEQSANPDHPDS